MPLFFQEAAASIAFFISRRTEELVVAVRMRPFTPAWRLPWLLQLAPMIVITQGKGSLWVEGAMDVGGVLLSFVMKFMPVHAGAAIFVVR